MAIKNPFKKKKSLPPPLPAGVIGVDTSGTPVFARGGTSQQQIEAIRETVRTGSIRRIGGGGSSGGGGSGSSSGSSASIVGLTPFQIAQQREQERRRLEAQNKKVTDEIIRKQRAEAKRLASLTEAQRLAERRLKQKLQVDFELELNRQAKRLGRNLSLRERETIAGKVFETEAQRKARLRQEIIKRQRQTPLTDQQIQELQKFRNLLTKMKITEAEFRKQIFPGGTGGATPTKIQRFINNRPKLKKAMDKIPIQKIGQVLFGKVGEMFIGISTPKTIGIGVKTIPDITARQIKKQLRKGGLPGKVIATFIPTTPGEVAIFGGIAALGGGLGGKFLQTLTSGTLTTLGLKAAISNDLPTEERIAGGLIILGGLLSAGSLIKSRLGFVRTRTRISPIKKKNN